MERILKSLVLAIFMVVALTLLAQSAGHILLSDTLNYNEGWNAYHAQAVLEGRSLYRNPLTPVNYPPLSFFIIAGISRLGFDPLLTGRFLSFGAVVFLAILIFKTVGLLGGSLYAKLFATFFFLWTFCMLAFTYLGVDDPQILGEALMLLGLFIYLKKNNLYKKLLIVSGLFICGLLIKQTLVIVPLIVSLDLIINRRKFLPFWIGVFVLPFLMINLIISYWAGNLYLHFLFLPRSFSFLKFYQEEDYLKTLLFPILGSFLFSIYWMIKKRYLIPLYFLCSLIFGAYFLGVEGTSVNMLFDLFISMALVLGILVDQLPEFGKTIRRNLAAPFFGLFLLMVIFFSIFDFFPLLPYYQNAAYSSRIYQSGASFISVYPNPVICETIFLCYLAKKDFVYDPFNIALMIKHHDPLIDEQQIVSQIKEGKFSLIQTEESVDNYSADLGKTGEYTNAQDRFSAPVIEAIKFRYKLVYQNASGYFYAPSH